MESLEDVHPVSAAMRAEVVVKLREIEHTHDVTLLFACESGSRGWGFASPDGDYDVRFIYVHRLPWYLKVRADRNVIGKPIAGDRDVNGWELRKALALMAKGNATLIEWLDSPIVYLEHPGFLARMREAARLTFQAERSFHHDVHMARGKYRG